MATQQSSYRQPTARSAPWRSIASIAYSEQVGTKRQECGSIGETNRLYTRKQELHCLLHFASATRARCAASLKPRDYFVSSVRRNGNVSTLLRGLKTMSTGPSQAASQPYRFAHAALDAIALHRSAQHLADGQSHSRTACRSALVLRRRRKNTVMLPVNCRRPF